MQIKNRQQLLTIAALVVIGLYAGDKLLLSPLTAAWKARATRITELRNEIAQGKSLLDREQSIRSRWEQIRRSTLPNNKSVAEQQFFKAADQWAQDSRVTLTGTSGQWKQESDDYMTYQCRVDASGNLGTLSKFLYDIEKDPMALKMESIEIGARDKEGQQLSLGLQISGLALAPQPK